LALNSNLKFSILVEFANTVHNTYCNDIILMEKRDLDMKRYNALPIIESKKTSEEMVEKTLEELISASQQGRATETDLPKDLYKLIKIKPPVAKRRQPDKIQEKPAFKEKLVELLVQEQNKHPRDDEISQVSINDNQTDPKTIKLINRYLANQDIENEEQLISNAFTTFFESSIRNATNSDLEESCIQNICNCIPEALRMKHHTLAISLMNEIEQEFRECNKYSAVQSILKKPNHRASFCPKTAVQSTWNEQFNSARLKIGRAVFLVNPILRHVQQLWFHYKNTRILEVSKIFAQSEPFRIFSYRNMIMIQCEKTKTLLWNG
jgi:hypothetical protein